MLALRKVVSAERCSTLRHLDRKRPGTARVSETFRPGGSAMLAAEGSALEVLAHGATHIRLESSDEGQVECWNFDHRRATLAAFARVGVHFTRTVVGELLLGMRWQHLHLFARYRSELMRFDLSRSSRSTRRRSRVGTWQG